jgi:hypothetical protein
MRNLKVAYSIAFALALASATLCGPAFAQTMGEYGGVTGSTSSGASDFKSDADFGPSKNFGSDSKSAPAQEFKGSDFKSSDFKSDQNSSSSNNSNSDFKSSDFGSSQNIGPSKW